MGVVRSPRAAAVGALRPGLHLLLAQLQFGADGVANGVAIASTEIPAHSASAATVAAACAHTPRDPVEREAIFDRKTAPELFQEFVRRIVPRFGVLVAMGLLPLRVLPLRVPLRFLVLNFSATWPWPRSGPRSGTNPQGTQRQFSLQKA